MAVGFALGIVVSRRSAVPALLACGVALALAGAGLRSVHARTALLVVAAVSAGWLLGALYATRAAPVRAMARGFPRCTLDGAISQRSGLGTFVKLDAIRCGAQRASTGEVVMDIGGEPGAQVRAEGWLMPLRGSGFGALRASAGAAAEFRTTEADVDPPNDPLFGSAAAVRAALRAATEDREPVVAGLTRGLAIGETDLIPAADAEAMRRAGLSHLVAVSGTNVTIVLSAIAACARRLSRGARLAACAAGLLFFVTVVGPEPSVLRAAAMGAVGMSALVAGTPSRPLNALALAVIAVLALRPPMVHALGLHLSVAATAGICLWARALEERMPVGPSWLRTAAGVTTAAQVAVAPLLIGAFGEVSLAGLPANLLAAPVVPLATVLGLAAALVGLVWPAAAVALVAVASPGMQWIATVGRVFGGSDAATLTVPRWSAWVVAVAFGLALLRRRLLPL